jgi:hypothetical protein
VKVEKKEKWIFGSTHNRAPNERGNLVAAVTQVFEFAAEVVGSTTFSEIESRDKRPTWFLPQSNWSRNRHSLVASSWQCPTGHLE